MLLVISILLAKQTTYALDMSFGSIFLEDPIIAKGSSQQPQTGCDEMGQTRHLLISRIKLHPSGLVQCYCQRGFNQQRSGFGLTDLDHENDPPAPFPATVSTGWNGHVQRDISSSLYRQQI
jgi:hypothetical protein